jgi:hypothetical protein
MCARNFFSTGTWHRCRSDEAEGGAPDSILKAAAADEPDGVEFGERGAEFFQFSFGAVDFETIEVGEFGHLGEERADVIEVGESGFGVLISFAAEDFVAIDGEIVEEVAGFGGGFGEELREQDLDLGQFAGFGPEVRMEADHVGGVGFHFWVKVIFP